MGLFVADAAVGTALVVVAWPHRGGVGQGKQNLGQASVHVGGAARLKVGATATVDQQGVAGEHMVAPQKTHAAGGVARGVQRGEALVAKTQGVAVLQLHTRGANATARWRCGARASELGQVGRAGDVVGVGVGFDGPDQLQAVFAQGGQVALDLGVHRIDDHRLAAGLVKQHIGVGAGFGVEQLDRFHG